MTVKGYKGVYNQHEGTLDHDASWGLFYDLPPKEELTHARIVNKLAYGMQYLDKDFSPEQQEKIQKNMFISLQKNNLTLLDKSTDLKSIAPPQKKDNFKDFIQTIMTSICFNLLPQEVLFSDSRKDFSKIQEKLKKESKIAPFQKEKSPLNARDFIGKCKHYY